MVPLVWNDHRFQSTLPAGERQSSSLLCVVLHYISTHALRMGSDGSLICDFDPGKFQSTPPAWGATGGFPLGFYGVSISIHPPRMGSDNGRCIVLGALAISIHAPRMGSDSIFFSVFTTCKISIHAPRMGSDLASKSQNVSDANFNPRSPHGERPPLVKIFLDFLRISIHAPRMGSDSMQLVNRRISNTFQSTLPAWGATRPSAVEISA